VGRSLQRDSIAHSGTVGFGAAKDKVVFLGPLGTGQTHLATGFGIRACQAGTTSPSPPRPSGYHASARLKQHGGLHGKFTQLARLPLLVIDEVGYIPFVGEATNLFSS
jgi:DNA replication protein DnaC